MNQLKFEEVKMMTRREKMEGDGEFLRKSKRECGTVFGGTYAIFERPPHL